MKMYPIEAATASRDLDCEYSLPHSSEMQAALPAASWPDLILQEQNAKVKCHPHLTLLLLDGAGIDGLKGRGLQPASISLQVE